VQGEERSEDRGAIGPNRVPFHDFSLRL
jgi:hypothetical protein